MEILLFIDEDDEVNLKALAALESLAAREVRIVRDTKALQGYVLLPFIELPDGQRHYGLTAIQKYAGITGT